jgi:hypothetical protein
MLGLRPARTAQLATRPRIWAGERRASVRTYVLSRLQSHLSKAAPPHPAQVKEHASNVPGWANFRVREDRFKRRNQCIKRLFFIERRVGASSDTGLDRCPVLPLLVRLFRRR